MKQLTDRSIREGPCEVAEWDPDRKKTELTSSDWYSRSILTEVRNYFMYFKDQIPLARALILGFKRLS